MTDQKIIDLILNGRHSRALAKLYKIYPAVLKYVMQAGGTQNDTEDIFQDALVIFIEKVSQNDFVLSSSISTYIFGICKNLCYEKRRFANKQLVMKQEENDEESKKIEDFLEEEKKYQKLDSILIETGQKCLELLKMFYLDKLSMKIIAQRLGFKSETSAKTQKYKCIEKARNLAGNILLESQTQIN